MLTEGGVPSPHSFTTISLWSLLRSSYFWGRKHPKGGVLLHNQHEVGHTSTLTFLVLTFYSPKWYLPYFLRQWHFKQINYYSQRRFWHLNCKIKSPSRPITARQWNAGCNQFCRARAVLRTRSWHLWAPAPTVDKQAKFINYPCIEQCFGSRFLTTTLVVIGNFLTNKFSRRSPLNILYLPHKVVIFLLFLCPCTCTINFRKG